MILRPPADGHIRSRERGRTLPVHALDAVFPVLRVVGGRHAVRVPVQHLSDILARLAGVGDGAWSGCFGAGLASDPVLPVGHCRSGGFRRQVQGTQPSSGRRRHDRHRLLYRQSGFLGGAPDWISGRGDFFSARRGLSQTIVRRPNRPGSWPQSVSGPLYPWAAARDFDNTAGLRPNLRLYLACPARGGGRVEHCDLALHFLL